VAVRGNPAERIRKKSRSRWVRVHVLHALNDTSSLSTAHATVHAASSTSRLSTQPCVYPRSVRYPRSGAHQRSAPYFNAWHDTASLSTQRYLTYPRSGTHQRSAPYYNVWLTIHATLRGHVVTLRGIATPSVSRDISLLTYLPVYRQ